MTQLHVQQAGPRTLVQDAGRPGYADLGISACGAWDRACHAVANSLVGNDTSAAALEILMGGFRATVVGGDVLVALSGAECELTVDEVARPTNSPVWVRDGQQVSVSMATRGLRAYLAVTGGIDGTVTFDSRSSDPTRGMGPAVVGSGEVLEIGGAVAGTVLIGGDPRPIADELVLHAVWGPRDDWFSDAAHASFATQRWTVTDKADRVGTRLDGQPLERSIAGELVSEATVRGAVQVPTAGVPVVFGPDHPTTGGYPVIAVVDPDDADLLAQARPGTSVNFDVRRSSIDLALD